MNSAHGRIFISYSHRLRGPEWKRRLLAQLDFFEKHGLIDAWDDEQFPGGYRWEKEIEKAIHEARLAVILLTKEALESEFILQRELVPLSHREKDGLIAIPIHCEPCACKEHPWLKQLQIRPFEALPLSTITSDAECDRVLRRLATEIAEELGRSALRGISSAPAPVRTYLDKFPLTRGPGLREEKLIGREQELALLDLAFAQPHTAIVSLVAWGGVGKTMLVQHWLRRLEGGRVHKDDPANPWFGARRVYAWSFYSQGAKEDRQASEDTFLAHALEWFGVQCEPTLSPWDKGRLLADAVARERTLLILDGIEPLQYPPGPMGGQLRKVGEDESHLRAPGLQSLLKQLAARAKRREPTGLCLVTTRVWLADLNDHKRSKDNPAGTVLRVDLGNLTEEAGAALLHYAGAKRAGAAEIKPDDRELLDASREVDGHALTLNLLGRFLLHAHKGDILQRALVRFEEADRAKQGGTTFKMLAAFEHWFNRGSEIYKHQLAILRILGLFDRPADEGCIAALRKPPVIAGLTDPLFTTRQDASTGQAATQPLLEEDLNTATSLLADFGLVVMQASVNDNERLLDCHPLIREHFARRLHTTLPEAWTSGHFRLYTHLETSAEFQPQTLERMEPLYHAVFHGCEAGFQFRVLTQIYVQRIMRGDEVFSLHNLGAFASDLAALACFYEKPWKVPSAKLDESWQAWLLNTTAFTLESTGRLVEAEELLQVGLEMRLKEQNWKHAAINASNLSQLLQNLGNLGRAVEYARTSVTLADKSGDGIQRFSKRSRLGDALGHSGNTHEAMIAFNDAGVLLQESEGIPMLYGVAGFEFLDLFMATPEQSSWCRMLKLKPHPGAMVFLEAPQRRASFSLRFASLAGWLLDVALDQLTLVRISLYRAILGETVSTPSTFDAVFRDSTTSIEGLRRAGGKGYLPEGLCTRAWVCFQKGDTAGARADLDEAWDIAERGPMRLHLADIHLHRARLFFRTQPYPWKSPQADLAAAEKLINDCGYHRRDQELADAKKAILGA